MSNPVWRKSTHSGTEQNVCVEVAALDGGIGVRDSKNPEAPHLSLAPRAFGRLLRTIKEQ